MTHLKEKTMEEGERGGINECGLSAEEKDRDQACS